MSDNPLDKADERIVDKLIQKLINNADDLLHLARSLQGVRSGNVIGVMFIDIQRDEEKRRKRQEQHEDDDDEK